MELRRFMKVGCLVLTLTTTFHSVAAISSPKKNAKLFSLRNNKNVMDDRLENKEDTILRGGATTSVAGPYAINQYDEILPRGWGDHTIVSPLNRWTWCVGYWTVCGIIAKLMGTLDYALKQEWFAPNNWYVLHLVMHLPLYLGAWDWSAFCFDRPFRFLASIVYPLMHNFDTLMWFSVFNLGKLILSKVYTGETSKLVQFLAGWIAFAVFIMWHRSFLELRCLPEHHPEPPSESFPEGRGSSFLYIAAGIIISIPTMAIYHFFGDMRWGLLLQFAANLYVAIRIRMPNPWDKYDNADKLNNEKYWLQYMNAKSY